ncbi:MAG TPA: efflux RND transporter periplasmic adaptor subunit [Sediminispirochaeta sp.]|nr:efflux RND transporter periplasmic adaptor subunit [Sediminispirochaeta sp.]
MPEKKWGKKIANIILIAVFAAGALGIYNSLGGEDPRNGGAGVASRPGDGPGAGRANRSTSDLGSGDRETSTRKVAVQTAELRRGRVVNYIKINGEVTPRIESPAYPDVSGRIQEYLVREGQQVRRGDRIALIDPSRPGESYSASAVVTPISGTLRKISHSIGDTVNPQSSVALITDLDSLVVETAVPERYVGRLRTGLRAELQFPAFPGEVFSALVDKISPALDESSRSLPIELSFRSIDPRILIGMFADIELVIEERRNVPILPRSAMLKREGQQVAFVVGEQNLAERRILRTGLEGRDYVEVIEGLQPGESIVVKGQKFLNDGDALRIIPGDEQ